MRGLRGVIQSCHKGTQAPTVPSSANLVPFSLIFILCEHDTLLCSHQMLLNPKKTKVFCLCALQTHTFGDASGGSIYLIISIVEWGGEGGFLERRCRSSGGTFLLRWRWAGMLNTPLCWFSSSDHSRSSKSSCWSSNDEKRGSSRSEHNASTSSKSLIPKESRLDTFWD